MLDSLAERREFELPVPIWNFLTTAAGQRAVPRWASLQYRLAVAQV
jgi:hypothetical protein